MESKRQQRKKARSVGQSRPNRRAEKRLKVAEAGYAIASKGSNANAYTKPGAQKRW